MAKAVIKAGICGYTTNVTADADDMANVTFCIESDCPNIKNLAQEIPVVDAYSEIGLGSAGEILNPARLKQNKCCTGCVVPCGIFKSMQVAAGLALPAPSAIELQND